MAFIAPLNSVSDHKHMVDMTSFADRLDLAIKLSGITNSRLASEFENGHQNLNNWRSRGRVPEAGFKKIRHLLPGVRLEWLNDNVGDSPEDVLTREKPIGARSISEWDGESELPATHQGIDRIEVFLSAGEGRGVSQAEPQQLTPNVFRADFLRAAGWSRRTHFSMYVRGDSMETKIPDGSTVVVDVTDRDPKGSKSSVYAILVDGEPRLKRLLRLPGGAIRVSSDNQKPEYAAFDVGPESRHELEIIGRVVHLSTTLD